MLSQNTSLNKIFKEYNQSGSLSMTEQTQKKNWETYKCVYITRTFPNNHRVSEKKSSRKLKMPSEEWKWKHDIWKFLVCIQSSAKRKCYSCKCPHKTDLKLISYHLIKGANQIQNKKNRDNKIRAKQENKISQSKIIIQTFL